MQRPKSLNKRRNLSPQNISKNHSRNLNFWTNFQSPSSLSTINDFQMGISKILKSQANKNRVQKTISPILNNH